MEIKYNIPISVTKEQYNSIRKALRGVIASRTDIDGNYWVKLWNMKYSSYLAKILA